MADGSLPARQRHMDILFLALGEGPGTLPELLPLVPSTTRFVCALRMEQAGIIERIGTKPSRHGGRPQILWQRVPGMAPPPVKRAEPRQPRAKYGSRETRVMQALASGPLRSSDVAQHLDRPVNHTNNALSRMQRKGLVRIVGRGERNGITGSIPYLWALKETA